MSVIKPGDRGQLEGQIVIDIYKETFYLSHSHNISSYEVLTILATALDSLAEKLDGFLTEQPVALH